MNKRKELKALLVENPWLKDHISSLEAQISELARTNAVLRMNYDETLEENEELEEAVALRQSKLHAALNDHASLNSRYQQLLSVVVTLTREAEKNDQEE